MRLGTRSLLAGLVIALTGLLAFQTKAQTQPPDYKEVYDLLRQHLAGTTEADLNRTAVESLIAALGPRVVLLPPEGIPAGPTNSLLISRSNLFDGPIAYIRIAHVDEGLADALKRTYDQLRSTNKLNGVVLDLRYGTGSDYPAALAAAGLFISKERPLLDWGKGMVASKENADAITLPVTVLVNRQTAGSAEALAAVLREAGAGLVLGNRTAGAAMIAEEYPLKNGERLQIATSPLRLADGSNLSPDGLKPDIVVELSAQSEKAYFADAFYEAPQTNRPGLAGLSSTNASGVTNRQRIRFNEAELVRERREGFNPELDLASGHASPERPVVRDPALARALDVLKGLAVVRASRS